MAQEHVGFGRPAKTFDRPDEIELSRHAAPTRALAIPEITCAEAAAGWERYRPDALPGAAPIPSGEAFLVLGHFADAGYDHVPDCPVFVSGTLETCREKWWQDLREPDRADSADCS